MKKLLVLALVLGLASVANAVPLGLELSYGGQTDGSGTVYDAELIICETVVIDIVGPADLDYLGFIIIEGVFPGAGGEWGDNIGPWDPMCSGFYYENLNYPIIHAGAGDMASIARYVEEGWGFGYEITAAQAVGANPGGLQFELIYHCCGPISEYVTISLWDGGGDFTTPEDTIVIHQIPEPMTIALLGLGGLFLLRRRR